MAENRTLSISDIFKDLLILVEANQIMASDIRMEGVRRAKILQDKAIMRVADMIPLRKTSSVSDTFKRAGQAQ